MVAALLSLEKVKGSVQDCYGCDGPEDGPCGDPFNFDGSMIIQCVNIGKQGCIVSDFNCFKFNHFNNSPLYLNN
jgi:hypothetical protein